MNRKLLKICLPLYLLIVTFMSFESYSEAKENGKILVLINQEQQIEMAASEFLEKEGLYALSTEELFISGYLTSIPIPIENDGQAGKWKIYTFSTDAYLENRFSLNEL
jgi:hypothetical protein